MRKLKFRAWDIKEKYWIAEGFSIIGERTVFNVLEQFQKERIEKYPGRSLLEAMKDLLIEQFTGLQDRNGKDIYEGDIVRWNTWGWIKPHMLVIFRQGKFMVEFVSKSFYEFNEYENCEGYAQYQTFEPEDWAAAEIIGNIHANSELLQDKN